MTRLPPGWTLSRFITVLACLACLGIALLALARAGTGPALSLANRLDLISVAAGNLFLIGLATVIAWRAGDVSANLSLALPFLFIGAADSFWLLFADTEPSGFPVRLAIGYLTFFLGAAFFIRATQLFPRRLTPADMIASPTIWGRVSAFRRPLTALLHPPLAWSVALVLTLTFFTLEGTLGAEVTRLVIILLGVVYFYVSYRSGEAESRRKVLWFLQGALAALLFGLAISGWAMIPQESLGRAAYISVALTLRFSYPVVMIGCFAAAVFYAGAVSPALVIRKTLVYGTTATLLLFTFATIQAVVTDLLVEYIGVADRLASAMLGTLFGLTFQPLRVRTELLLKRFAPAEPAAGSAPLTALPDAVAGSV